MQEVKVLGRVYDATKYFRIFALAKVDKWKASTMMGCKFVDETRVAMGHTASAQTTQRVSFAVARYLVDAFDREFPAVLKKMSSDTRQVIERWVEWRMVAFGDLPDKIRPMLVEVLQDDFTVATITGEVAHWLDGWVVEKLTGELGIELSQKDAASKPFAEVFSAIGATFDLRPGSVMVRPNDPVITKVKLMVDEWPEEGMVRWEFEKVERLAGIVSFVVAFLRSREAKLARWRVMRQLAVQASVPTGMRFMRSEVRQGVVDVLNACSAQEYGGMVRCPTGFHAGADFCAADARASV